MAVRKEPAGGEKPKAARKAKAKAKAKGEAVTSTGGAAEASPPEMTWKVGRDIYRVVDSHTHQVAEHPKHGELMGFETKSTAKGFRNLLNGGSSSGRFIVSRGRDHPLGPSDGTSVMRRGRHSRW